MKIDVFRYIDEAIASLDAQRDNYLAAAKQIAASLKRTLAPLGDDVLDISFRIKEDDSLKEKILRKHLYKEYPANELVANVHDIIGVRVECRFLSDEARICAYLKQAFTETEDGVSFWQPNKPRLKLKLGPPQPELQQNGFEIYRIDGTVEAKEFACRFELQIKSLVNVFWSEIEHEIIYKNKRFMMIDNFVTEQMKALNRSLQLIDRQLNMLYDRCLDRSTSLRQKQVENLLTLFINELFSRIVQANIGFEVGIKPLAESIMKYIFYGSSFSEKNDQSDQGYARTLMQTMNWMRKVDFADIKVGEELTLSTVPVFTDRLEQILSRYFLTGLNSDFFCNLFFHMLFSIETGDNASDFTDYIHYLRKRLGAVPATGETEKKLERFLAGRDYGSMLSEQSLRELRSCLSEGATEENQKDG